ncbi:MAG TPA: 3-dehydroquinate synthase [Chthoniobacterales bacterium]|nr:3-dehydroquinate synthase [Chthoniobacterales bacterium]
MLYFDVTKVQVTFGTDSYDVVLGSHLLREAGRLISDRVRIRRCVIVTDTNIAPLFAAGLQKSLAEAGIHPNLVTIPAGEQLKTLETAGSVCERMLAMGLDRESFVIGLGGGVIGDLSGFVAAIFQRGVPHVQIPTTLLAMVDSSIGGKTGVNTASGKNQIGAVHHPALVIDDIEILRALPEREFRQGYAEVVKHAIIADAKMFEDLSRTDLSVLAPAHIPAETLPSLIRRNIEIKSRIAGGDQHDRKGERALLNFGHTVGHGIERAGDYKTYLHGEAISLGIVAALEISVRRAGLTHEERATVIRLLERFQLPTGLPQDFPRERIIEALKFDKKFQNGEIRFVVVPRIGSGYLSNEVTMEDIREAVNAL